jgi:hypothetical protein
MSKIALSGNASGTGTFTLASPNSSTDRTLDLPDASGVIDRLNRAGNVLQVVQGTVQASVSTTSTSYVTTNLTASITPTSATNKILVCVNMVGYNDTSTGQCIVTVFRGTVSGTDLAASNGSGFGAAFTSTGGEVMSVISGMILDSPSTTASTTYTVGFKRKSTGTAYVMIDNQLASITLMEIAA